MQATFFGTFQYTRCFMFSIEYISNILQLKPFFKTNTQSMNWAVPTRRLQNGSFSLTNHISCQFAYLHCYIIFI